MFICGLGRISMYFIIYFIEEERKRESKFMIIFGLVWKWVRGWEILIVVYWVKSGIIISKIVKMEEEIWIVFVEEYVGWKF